MLKDFYKHGACSVTQDAGICCVGQRDNDLATGRSRDGERWIQMQELPEAYHIGTGNRLRDFTLVARPQPRATMLLVVRLNLEHVSFSLWPVTSS